MESTAERKEDGINAATPGEGAAEKFGDGDAFKLVDAREDVASQKIQQQNTMYIEQQRNRFLSADLADSLSNTLNESSKNDDAYVKQLETQDLIRRAKEYALFKHQHNWGVFHNYAEGGQADNISREEWDTEVFSQTIEEPRCSKVNRGCSIASHLAMFIFCVWATLTLTGNTFEDDEQSKSDSESNFGVCPERCRPHGTCKRNFLNEFDKIVWRQSTHVDKNCADTCKRHATKCKPYYPKNNPGSQRNECVKACKPLSVYLNHA